MVVDADEEQSQELCMLLQQHSYRTTASQSLLKLEEEIEQGGCRVVILNLDTLPVDNLFFRALKRKNPEACIIGLSNRSFHPELEEAMSKHINACLGKPVDEEELVFWVKSLLENIPGAS